MKVGILTFHRADSYGAVLQAFALQTAIAGMGADCEIVDYRSSAIEDEFKPKRISDAKNLSQLIANTLNRTVFAAYRRQKRAEFLAFRENYLRIGPSYPRARIGEAEGRYDIFISGSDQVFNYNITKSDYTYLLDFVKESGKRNAYAASFGLSELSDEEAERYAPLLERFNLLTLREEQGCQIVKALTGRDCPVVIDPVLLMTDEQWSAYTPPQERRPYVFLYQLNHSRALLDEAMAYAGKHGLDLRIVTPSILNTFRSPGRNGQYIKDAGPMELVSLIKNAAYVFTDSFHGTAFSVCFNRPFVTQIAELSKGSRMDSLLGLLDLRSRLLDLDTNLEAPIDYSAVNERLKRCREESLDHLRQIVFSRTR